MSRCEKVVRLHDEVRAAIRARIAAGATSQVALARATFLSQPYISLVLAGRREASALVLDELCEAAEVTVEAMVAVPGEV